MDVREQRGREIAERARIVKRGNAWIVPSQSLDNGSYAVTLESGEVHCTCPDFDLRAKPCKHIFAAAFFVQRQTVTEVNAAGETRTTVTETAAVRVTYSQNWPAYNRAQTQEKETFCRLLRDLAASVPEPVQERGRPRMPIGEAIFSAGFKVYTGMSGRRFMTDMREAAATGYVSRPWHFNSVLGAIEDPELTPILHQLVTASAAPLGAVESTFAVDSTGFGVQAFYRHFSAKYGHDQYSQDYLKLHALIGTRTNVIAAATVTDRDAHDSPQLRPLIEAGAASFDVTRVVADKAYSSRANVDLVTSIGAEPLIPFRSSAREFAKYSRTTPAWSRLWHLYNFKRDEFLAHYHARSNAESTFSAIKRVFGDTLRSKTRTAQVNELLFKVIAHNIVCLVHSMCELDVTLPAFAQAS
jgi:transposase